MKVINKLILLSITAFMLCHSGLRADVFHVNSTTTDQWVTITMKNKKETQYKFWPGSASGDWVNIYSFVDEISSVFHILPGQSLQFTDYEEDSVIASLSSSLRTVSKGWEYSVDSVWNPAEEAPLIPPIIAPDDEWPVNRVEVKGIYILTSSSGARMVSDYTDGGGETFTVSLGETVTIESIIWADRGWISDHEFGTYTDVNMSYPKSSYYSYSTFAPSADNKDSRVSVTFTASSLGSYMFDVVGSAAPPLPLEASPLYNFPITIEVTSP